MTDTELQHCIDQMRRFKTDLAQVEAKRSERELPRSVPPTLSAFSNAHGGVLLLGVDEHAGFAVIGVTDAKKVSQDLQSQCAAMEPPVRAVIGLHTVDNQTVIVAEIPEIPNTQKPCYIKAAGMTNGAFIRTGDGDHKLTEYEIHLMMASRGHPVDDLQPVDDATIDDLNPDQLGEFLRRCRQSSADLAAVSDLDVLRQKKVMRQSSVDGRGWVPTVAGLLALGRHPQGYLHRLCVEVAVYPGRHPGDVGPNSERLIETVVREGSIPAMVHATMEVLWRNLRTAQVVSGTGGVQRLEIPEEALREALANALGHRDLHPLSFGMPVQVQVFAHQVVVSSPGGLHGHASSDTLGIDYTTGARNPVLMRLLEDAVIPGTKRTVVESRGSGVAAMMTVLRTHHVFPARLENKIGMFRTVFPRATTNNTDAVTWLRKIGADQFSQSQQTALLLLQRDDAMTINRYRQLSGSTSREAVHELQALIDAGLVVRRDAARVSDYVLNVDAPSPRQAPAPRRARVARVPRSAIRAAPVNARVDRRPEILEFLRQEGPLSVGELMARLRLSRTPLRGWLQKLVATGDVQFVGTNAKDPNGKYRIRTPAHHA